jgi:hypothetical protein
VARAAQSHASKQPVDDDTTIASRHTHKSSKSGRTSVRSGATRMTGATEASNADRLVAVKRNLPRGATYQELALSRPNKPPQGRVRFHWSVGPRRPTTTTVADRKAWKIANRLPPSLLGPLDNDPRSANRHHCYYHHRRSCCRHVTISNTTNICPITPIFSPTPPNHALATILVLAPSASDEPRWALAVTRRWWGHSLHGR